MSLDSNEFSLNIDRVGNLGQGVGSDESGNVYFVAGAVPGDRVRVLWRATPRPEKYRDAQLVEIERPSESRQASPCRYFPECGGCDWLNWQYSEQLKAKESIVSHTLSRIGLVPGERLPIIPSEQTLGYRTRIQVSRENGKLGFFRRNTRSVVDVETCAIARPELNEKLAGLRAEKTPEGARGREELFIDSAGQSHRRGIEMYGLDFAQIHEGQNLKLRARVAEWMALAGARNVVELYCGNGNLTFTYADRVEKVWAADSSKWSIEKANKEAAERELAHRVRFEVRQVGYTLRHRLPQDVSTSYDTLLLDPPRQGIGGDVLREWATNNLKNIVYVSCSPNTFAQDLTKIREMFDVRLVQAIDMFPQTRHVEVVGLLQRRC